MIKVYKYEGKDEEECLTNCIEELDVYACDYLLLIMKKKINFGLK